MRTKKAIRLASVDHHFPLELFLDSDSKTIGACYEFCADRKIPIINKSDDGIYPESATVGPFVVWLPVREQWNRRSEMSKAELLIHEISHITDRDHVGFTKWTVRYINPIYTIITEARAYACGFCYQIHRSKQIGMPIRRREAEATAKQRARKVYDKYIPLKFLLSRRKAEKVFYEGFMNIVSKHLEAKKQPQTFGVVG